MAIPSSEPLAESPTPTAFAVHCRAGCANGKPIYLTEAEYDRQLSRPDSLWKCPRCGDAAHWDDEIYESAVAGELEGAN